MVSNSAKLDHRTKQHTEFGVSTSNGSRDMARTKVAEKKKKKEKKMNVDNPIKHPLRGSLITQGKKKLMRPRGSLGLTSLGIVLPPRQLFHLKSDNERAIQQLNCKFAK